MTRAALYARYSDDKQSEAFGPCFARHRHRQ